ncbi:MAG: 30S ribosomal protein S8 [Candidatus Eremiobacteraeota bacterium]|nr:30S ribosomal protein S8 [Candidatus Eremiobacteraeota bacterium]MBC5826655.1 30S ribosomal protein S8 [Candidatus Eremiobacteraeota bacterium]
MAMVTDPVADMLTRIRNANTAYHDTVDIPVSRLKKEIAKLLKAEGFVKSYEIVSAKPRDVLRIALRYGDKRERVLTGLKRVSRPGLRVYKPKGEIPRVMGGMGLIILSTSRGVLSGKQAKRLGCGGEVMALVW